MTRARIGGGAPSFCWCCNRQLQRAPGKGLGLFYFELVVKDGYEHRVHQTRCLDEMIADGARLVPRTSDTPKLP